MNIFESFIKGMGMIFGSFIPKPYVHREYNPMAECANRMKETGERLSRVLKRYEEKNEERMVHKIYQGIGSHRRNR